VFLLQDGLALVQTVDLLTPIVEDPYTFGRIAAANSLSDVYAMGGTPLTVLNIVGFPGPMDKKVLAEILRGGQDTVGEAGAVVAGGHTFNEKEIKYGLSVTGRIDPKRIVTNAAVKVGDVLVLTKPLGTGVFAQAMMTQDEVDSVLYKAATASMMQLNKAASEIMLACDVHSATDITGYGFLGHTQEMAQGSGVRLRRRGDERELVWRQGRVAGRRLFRAAEHPLGIAEFGRAARVVAGEPGCRFPAPGQ